MAAATTGGDLNAMHGYKLPPPHFTGEYATFEEWKHKFVAYLGPQNSQFPRLLQIAETFDQPLTDELLADGARNREEADLWIQLSKDLHYLLTSTSAKDKQLSFADNIHYKQLVSRHGDNYTDASQFHLVHAVSGTLQSF